MQIIKINPKKLEKTKLTLVINLLKQGRVIIFPTDTVYIPVADATNRKAVKKVFQIKQRSQKNPIPIFIKNIKAAKKLARIDKTQEKFLKTVWPGKVTVILKRKARKRLYGVGRKTIALRIPDFKPANFLLEKLNTPLVGTSANISGQPPPGNIKEVLQQFGYSYSHGRIRISRTKGKRALFACPDLVVDAGNLPKSKPSIVLDIITFPPKILRP